MTSFSVSIESAISLLAHADAGLVAIVGRSLWVSLLACLWACTAGLFLGAWLGVARFRGRSTVLLIMNTLLAIPSVVVGLIVYLLLSRSGPLGWLNWLFNWPAMVLAQGLLVMPLMAALVRQIVEDSHNAFGEQLQSMGLSTALQGILLAWNERLALLMVLITTFGRAISEVGAVMIVGGNIDGFTRVMTTAIALETSKGDLPLALGLGMVLLGVVGTLHLILALLRSNSGKQLSTR